MFSSRAPGIFFKYAVITGKFFREISVIFSFYRDLVIYFKPEPVAFSQSDRANPHQRVQMPEKLA
jgi:hypothetical protein